MRLFFTILRNDTQNSSSRPEITRIRRAHVPARGGGGGGSLRGRFSGKHQLAWPPETWDVVVTGGGFCPGRGCGGVHVMLPEAFP